MQPWFVVIRTADSLGFEPLGRYVIVFLANFLISNIEGWR